MIRRVGVMERLRQAMIGTLQALLDSVEVVDFGRVNLLVETWLQI